MKRIIALLVIISMMLAIGCEPKVSEVPEEHTGPAIEVIKPVIPWEERKFVYNNGITIDQKSKEERDENKVRISYDYPVISGLKNKEVQQAINKELEENSKSMLKQLEENFLKAMPKDTQKFDGKYAHTYVTYNYNNLIFVQFSAGINVNIKNDNYIPMHKRYSIGYDLNTGNKVTLKDIFKPGTDYKSLINNFICQFIIENNYDDYETERMTKPFQGIREDQSFYFDLDGLRIVLDEKNDEFVNLSYGDIIYIPMKHLQNDIYIFDKYFDEGFNIYEKGKLTKKLVPNLIEFQSKGLIDEGNERYYMNVVKGEFINVPDKEIEKLLNDMAVCKYDLESFKRRAKDDGKPGTDSHFGHWVGITLNAGGYLSVLVTQDINLNGKFELQRKIFNYDFNNSRELKLKDLFKPGTNLAGIMKRKVRSMGLPIAGELIDKYVDEAVRLENFYIDESSINIKFTPENENTNANAYDQWVWIPFEEIGIENVTILN